MGAIKATELDNGNIGLEITYGGTEAPFGGVDSSAPPAYIDPKCFAQCDGFIVVEGRLVAAAMNPVAVPTLWGGTPGVLLIGFGNFYTQTYGQLNYALGYTAVATTGSPTGVAYTFYMTAWNPANSTQLWNDSFTESLLNSAAHATNAYLSMQLQSTSPGAVGNGAAVTITTLTTLTPSYPSGVTTSASQTSEGGLFINGVLSGAGMTISGGTGYTPNTVYWVQQGANVTGQITVLAVDGGGGISGGYGVGWSLVANSYVTSYVGPSNVASSVATAGKDYVPTATTTASLVYSTQSNVVLEIAGSRDYTVASNGVNFVPPALAGSGASFAIGHISVGGAIVNTQIGTSGPSYNNAAIVGIYIPYMLITNGTGYNVGEIYQLVSAKSGGRVGNNVVNFGPTSPNTFGSGVWVEITGIGTGGSVTSARLLGTGLQTSTIIQDTGVSQLVFYLATTGAAIGVATLTGSGADVLTNMAAAINAGDPAVTASVNITASTLTLTADVAGAAGNAITVQDKSTITGPNLYYYYFPVRTVTNLIGGSDGSLFGTVLSTTLPQHASIANVGGVLFVGNIGPMIIKYGGPGIFTGSTTYQGVRQLKKFGGSLIGLGVIPAPGAVLTGLDMMFAWSAALNLDVWNPLDLNNNITGAGFNQLADIGDYLSGLVVSNGTAFILRAEGESYATSTGNATSPFNWAHISLGDTGEGAQFPALVCQYGQTGAYVGNSNIYQVSSSISAIGDKIKTALYNVLGGTNVADLSCVTCALYIVDEVVVVIFAVGNTLFAYNTVNGTWQTLTLKASLLASNTQYLCGVFASANSSIATPKFNQTQPVLCLGEGSGYNFYSLQEGLTNTNSASLAPSVTFPVEEVAFGRDITIDAIYLALYANLADTVALNFSIGGVSFGSLVLTHAEFPSIGTTPIEFAVFPTGVFTTHSPQLQVTITGASTTHTNLVRFTKLTMFGSYDPSQRPV